MTEASRAALLMTLCMAAFAANDAIMKALGETMPLGQALFLRGVGATAILAVLAARQNVLVLRLGRRERHLIAYRALAEIAAGFFFLTAVFNMPLANATAILQAVPLVVTLVAAWLLGEQIGIRRLTAIAVGLFGVLLILRPGPDGFNVFALSAVAAVISVTARDLVTRSFPAHLPTFTAAVWSALAVAVFGAALGLLEIWIVPGSRELALVAASTLTILAAYLLSFAALRAGAAGASAPFRYTALIWSLLLGFFAFGEWPDLITLVGAAIVCATGIYTILRELYLGRAKS